MLRKIITTSLFIFLAVIGFTSCDSNIVYSDFKSTGGSWQKNDTITFQFQEPDTISPYNMFLEVRNDQNYPYSNLYVIVEMNFPNSEVVSDTLQYAMAKPDGEWLGTGFDVKESKLWYKENVKFPSSGNYKVTVQQAVRKLGNVQGDQALDGITDVGITIEKATK